MESATEGEQEGGQSSHKENVGHLQPEKITSETRALELKLTEVKEAHARLEEDMRLLKEELKNQ